MDKGDRDAAFADSGGDTLHRAEADVPASEDAWHARLDAIGAAAFFPSARFDYVVASQNVATRVPEDFGRQPAGFGIGANERLLAARFVGPPIHNVDRREVGVAVDGCHFGMERRPNVGAAPELPIVVVPPTVVADVPEPSTWAMLLIGFTGLGYAASRRSKALISTIA
jgi:hypothetical protein